MPPQAYVLNRDGLAITLDREFRPFRVKPSSGTTLPTGFSICYITEDETETVAQVIREWDGRRYNRRMQYLEEEWKKQLTMLQWGRKARDEPFVSIDIESDGAKIWQAALIPSDDSEPYISYDDTVQPAELQEHLNRLLPGRTLVGHNVHEWDIGILGRHGVHIGSDAQVWDTYQTEQALCIERHRPTFALQTKHNADSDARRALELARNQWLRKFAPPSVSEKAWADVDAFFIVPLPQWTRHVPEFEIAKHSWENIEATYVSLDFATVKNDVRQVVWHVFPPTIGDDGYEPFNPGSPKRIDYWHRLLPAIEAARKGGKAVLFVQYEQEVERLLNVIEGAFTGDALRGIRRLEKRGGLLIVHETKELTPSKWATILAEGLPDNSTVLIERMPEKEADCGEGDADSIGHQNDLNEDDEEIQSDDTDDGIEDRRKKKGKVPDLREFGKMALWQRQGENVRMVCLDARLWNKRNEAPFRCEQIGGTWHEVVPRETVEQAGFQQTNGEFSLKVGWEQEICCTFGVPSLHPFQRSRLARILPRDGLSYEYVERATGGGKSLIFQAAALYRGAATGRLTVVVSPLRALIHDQVDKLHSRGFAMDVEALSGDMSRPDIEEAYRRIAGGETTMVYTAPERFRSKTFQRALETRIQLDAGGQPEYWVFDEAHCISLWGLEFRPDYRKAAEYIRDSRRAAGDTAAPVLLVSATLTTLAKVDIEAVLGFVK